MKTPFWALLLLVFLTVGLLLQSLRAHRAGAVKAHNVQLQAQIAGLQDAAAQQESARAELARLQAQEDSLQRELARLRAQVSERVRSSAAPATAAVQTAREAPPASMGTEAAMRSFVDSRLKLASERLNLTPEQAEALRGMVNRAVAAGQENLRRLWAGEATFDDIPTMQEWSQALEREILAQLTPEQQAAFHQHKEQELMSNARMAANTELLLIQGSLGLNPQQQDAMFDVLYHQAFRNMAPDPATLAVRPRDPVAAMDWEAGQKREALAGVLTPAQMENYQQLQDSYRNAVGRWLRPPPATTK